MAVGRPPQHTADDFVEAAIALADSDGLDALTLQRLGASLGVSTTAVYRYFPDKQALITAIHDRLLAQVAILMAPSQNPADTLRNMLHAFQAVARNHVCLGKVLLSADAKGQFVDAIPRLVVQCLEQLGLSGELLIRGYRQLETLVMGTAIFDFSGAPHHTAQRYARLSRLDHPAFAEHMSSALDVERVNEQALTASVESILAALIAESAPQVSSHVD